MSDPAPSNGFLPGGRRPPFFRYVLHLYSSDQVFRGIADFALIGAVVLLFMHPPSSEWFRGRTKPDATSAPKPAQQQTSVATDTGKAAPDAPATVTTGPTRRQRPGAR